MKIYAVEINASFYCEVEAEDQDEAEEIAKDDYWAFGSDSMDIDVWELPYDRDEDTVSRDLARW